MECFEDLILLRQGINKNKAYFIPNSESMWFDFFLKLAIALLGTKDCFGGWNFSASLWTPLRRIS